MDVVWCALMGRIVYACSAVGYGVTANIAASHLNLLWGVPVFPIAGSTRIAAARGSIPRIRILFGCFDSFDILHVGQCYDFETSN